MTAVIAAFLAAIAAMSAIGSVASRLAPTVLAGKVAAVERSSLRPHVLGVLGTWPVVRRIDLSERTRHRLATSGLMWSARELIGAKASLWAAATRAAAAVAGPFLPIPAGVLAWRTPDVVVARFARRRVAAADREIPVLLDLLAVATSAGLPPQLALRRAVEAATGPLADELRSVINATDLGGRWRDELASVGDRLDLPDLRRLLGALTRSDALGSSLSEEIARLADDVREARRAAATQRARTAPVKMLFPLVFLVLPAFLLLTVVPVLITTVRSIS